MTHSNQWLQERADLLTQMTDWLKRAQKAEHERDEAIKLLSEQARLLGMSAERELAMIARAEAAEAKVAMAKQALDFYAANNRADPNEGPWGVNSTDFGKTARAALAAMENTDD